MRATRALKGIAITALLMATILVSAPPAYAVAGDIATVAGTGNDDFSGDGGPATSAELNSPHGVLVDDAGNIYIADTRNHRVRMIAPDGVITTIAGIGAGYTGDGGLATLARLTSPTGLAFDADGNLFIADLNNSAIRKIDTNGIITTVAGTGEPGFSGDGGQASVAQLNRPVNVAFDAAGNLLIADTTNDRIRRVDVNGIITTIAGTTRGYSGDGGAATAAQLAAPHAIAVDDVGNLYIADEFNYRVRMVAPNGIITTIAGVGTQGFSGDGGAAVAAELDDPNALAFDLDGNLLISDRNNERIRLIDASGIITTIAGTGTAGYNGDGGAATAAHLNRPSGLAVDPQGAIYIADRFNNRIRRIEVNQAPVGMNDAVTIAEDGSVIIDVLDNDEDINGDALSIAPGSVSTPANGTITVGPGGILYEPDADYSGPDTFTYDVTDGSATDGPITVTIDVTPVPDAPNVVDDEASLTAPNPVTIDVLDNDSPVDADPIDRVTATDGAAGTTVVNGDLTVTYTPTSPGPTTDTFTYEACSGIACTTGTVTVEIDAGVNLGPTGVADSASTAKGAAVVIDVIGNDTDPNGDALFIAPGSITEPANGTVIVVAGGLFYRPDPTFEGIDSFTYDVTDGTETDGPVQVTITVIGDGPPPNNPPVAVDDDATTSQGGAVVIDVLTNDTDADDDVLFIAPGTVSAPSNGTAIIVAGGIFYRPDPTFSGTDRFKYRASDGTDTSNRGTVTVTVTAVSGGPTVIDDVSTLVAPNAVTIDVLANDIPDGAAIDTVTAANGFNGLTTVNPDLTVTYTPGVSNATTDTFTYMACAGAECGSATVTITITPPTCAGLTATIWGTGNAETIDGTEGDDVIVAFGGGDVVNADLGDDVVCGGGGNDQLLGGNGNDTMFGGQGDDRMFGGQGVDEMAGEAGDDTLHGNRGDDILDGGDGNDRIFGYANNDTIIGGPGDDRLHGHFGEDVITGGDGNDSIFGYGDDDNLAGGPGNDLISGNFGDDVLIGGAGNDMLFGADGNDRLSGNSGNDQLNGNSLDDVLDGGAGDDVLDGGINNDTCNGNSGADTATRCESTTGIP